LNILERIMQVELSDQERVLEYTLEEIMSESVTSVQATE
ncbi:stage 0 sporulation protein, partial [Butyricicoccus sp. 1XD8-22]